MTSEPSVAPAPADFGTRFSAFAIDAGLLFAVQWIAFIVLSRQLQAAGMTSTEPCVPGGVALCEGPSGALWALLLVLYVATTVGYHAWFEGNLGATPGKKWMGLAVVDSRGASPIGIVAGALRSVVRQSFWLSLLFVLDVSPLALGLPPMLFVLVPALAVGVFVVGAVRPDGAAAHDMVAGTRVVHTNQISSTRQAAAKQTGGEPADAENSVAAVGPDTDPTDTHNSIAESEESV